MVPSPQRLFPDRIRHSAHILISHPLGPVSFLTFFNGSKYADALAKLILDTQANVLLVYGDRDQFTSIKKYDAWIQKLEAIRAAVAERNGVGRSIDSTATASSASASTSRPQTLVGCSDSDRTIQHVLVHGSSEHLPPPLPKLYAEFQATLIPRADHFWRNNRGRDLRETVSTWVKKFDEGDQS